MYYIDLSFLKRAIAKLFVYIKIVLFLRIVKEVFVLLWKVIYYQNLTHIYFCVILTFQSIKKLFVYIKTVLFLRIEICKRNIYTIYTSFSRFKFKQILKKRLCHLIIGYRSLFITFMLKYLLSALRTFAFTSY